MADNRRPNIGTRRAFRLCPHCQAPALIRSSEDVTPTVKKLYMLCNNTDCGHTWIDQLAPVHTICPSQIPNPEVDIPQCPENYIRKHYRGGNRAPPEDPDQFLMFPDDPGEDLAAA